MRGMGVEEMEGVGMMLKGDGGDGEMEGHRTTKTPTQHTPLA